ncbi:protein DMP2-like [Diospyros lotus]|uniref:protein DMP2-like n=1 Tax=Diospyros lotus TaxID=55363 RepID=UPI0022588632|nr:protein DMP2-like [Diospyros lotus]
MGATTTTTSSSSSISGGGDRVTTAAAFSGLPTVFKLLPTGTVLLFQFVNPILTNSGQCTDSNKAVAGAVIVLCGLLCFVASFSDSYKGSDGQTHYGFATRKGIWPSPVAESVDLSAYRIGFADFVHAFFSVLVFAAVSLLDSDTMQCFYPSFEPTQKALIVVSPPVIGVLASYVFLVFPNSRQGIGYASSSTQQDSSDSSAIVLQRRDKSPDNSRPPV